VSSDGETDGERSARSFEGPLFSARIDPDLQDFLTPRTPHGTITDSYVFLFLLPLQFYCHYYRFIPFSCPPPPTYFFSFESCVVDTDDPIRGAASSLALPDALGRRADVAAAPDARIAGIFWLLMFYDC
jgi:hypothetical protein